MESIEVQLYGKSTTAIALACAVFFVVQLAILPIVAGCGGSKRPAPKQRRNNSQSLKKKQSDGSDNKYLELSTSYRINATPAEAETKEKSSRTDSKQKAVKRKIDGNADVKVVPKEASTQSDRRQETPIPSSSVIPSEGTPSVEDPSVHAKENKNPQQENVERILDQGHAPRHGYGTMKNVQSDFDDSREEPTSSEPPNTTSNSHDTQQGNLKVAPPAAKATPEKAVKRDPPIVERQPSEIKSSKRGGRKVATL